MTLCSSHSTLLLRQASKCQALKVRVGGKQTDWPSDSATGSMGKHDCRSVCFPPISHLQSIAWWWQLQTTWREMLPASFVPFEVRIRGNWTIHWKKGSVSSNISSWMAHPRRCFPAYSWHAITQSEYWRKSYSQSLSQTNRHNPCWSSSLLSSNI